MTLSTHTVPVGVLLRRATPILLEYAVTLVDAGEEWELRREREQQRLLRAMHKPAKRPRPYR